MSTRYGADLLAGSNPDVSGKAWWEPATVIGTNDLILADVLRVDEDGTNGTQLTTKVAFACGFFRVPAEYVGTPQVLIEWYSTKTTGDVRFGVEYRTIAGDGTDSMDPSSWEEAVETTKTTPGTAGRKSQVTLSLTGANFSPGELVAFQLYMDGVAAADTLAGARIVAGANFVYADA